MFTPDLPVQADIIRENGTMLMTGQKLPASITDVIDGTKKTRCRVSWKARATGFQSHGNWFGLDQEDALQRIVDDANRQYAGVIDHWIEYE
jgi:hypothetical protein